MREFVVMCAPNGARRTRRDHPALPITPDELANSARAICDVGASMIHVHVRDEDGGHTLDVGRYRDAIAAIRGAPMDAGDEISVADLTAAMERQGVGEPTEGDVVLIHTGWGRHWITDNATFNSGCPGIGLEAAAYLIEKGVAVVGADTWPVEVVPNPDPNLAFPVHQEFIPKNGIFIIENLKLEELAADEVYEFLFVFTPVPFNDD